MEAAIRSTTSCNQHSRPQLELYTNRLLGYLYRSLIVGGVLQYLLIKGWVLRKIMAKLNPDEYLNQLKKTKTAANSMKSSILQYEKTAAKHAKSIQTTAENGKSQVSKVVTELETRLTDEAAKFSKATGDERDTVTSIRKDAKNQYNRFSKTYTAAMNKRNGIEARHSKVSRLADEVGTNANNISKLHTKANKEKSDISSYLQSSRKDSTEINSIHTEAEKVKQEIENTYAITLDTTMAGTLVERRDTLKNRTSTWEKLYLGGVGLIGLAIIIILITRGNLTFIDVVTERLVFITPLVIIAFVVNRQFVHERKLYEEYAFKAAAAQSLRGYTLLLNSEFKDMPEARIDILQFVIKAMNGIYDREPLTQNPSNFYLMFGNRAARFEARLEEKIATATKSALAEANITDRS